MDSELINTRNFEAVVDWLEGRSDGRPPFAEEMCGALYGEVKERIRAEVAEKRAKTRAALKGQTMSLDKILASDAPMPGRREPLHVPQETAQVQEQTRPGEGKAEQEERQDAHPAKAGVLLPFEPYVNDEGFTELGLDSLSLSTALSWCFYRREHRKPTVSQIQGMLYYMYGTWLGIRKERICSEHPQVWKFGPVFPRAYNKLQKSLGADGTVESGEREFETLKAFNPNLSVFMSNTVERFSSSPAWTITAPHIAQGTPWASQHHRSPGEWGMRMEDKAIASWFRRKLQQPAESRKQASAGRRV